MRRKIPTTLTAGEVRKIIDQPNKRCPTGLRNKTILSLVWDSGARVSDITNLKPGNLNISKKEIIIKKGKGGVDRILSFSEYTQDLLKKYKADRPKGEYFFCTLKGNKLDRVYLYSMVRRYAKRVGITKKVGMHTLRHSFALNFYKNSNHDLIRLQKILGHKDIRNTQIYCYIDSTDVKEGLNNFYTKRDGDELKPKTLEERIETLEKELQKLKS